MKRNVFFSLFLAVALVCVGMISGCSEEQNSVTMPDSNQGIGNDDGVTIERPDVGDGLDLQGYGASWPYYSQWNRNQLIFGTGFDSRGQSGGECKVWVQNLITRVTDGRVSVPTNVCNSCSSRHLWNPDPYGHVRPMSVDIRNVPLGYAVQMSWGTTKLHTFIMGYKSADGFYMLDSNWYLDGRVAYHPVSYNYFNSLQNLKYTTYVIGW